MKTLLVGVAGYERMKARTLAIARIHVTFCL